MNARDLQSIDTRIHAITAAQLGAVQQAQAGLSTRVDSLETAPPDTISWSQTPTLRSVRASDLVVNNSATLAAAMSVALEAAALYRIDAILVHNSTVAAGARVGFSTIPTGATLRWWMSLAAIEAAILTTGVQALVGSSADVISRLHGIIRTTDAGSLVLGFAQNAAVVIDTTLRADSYLLAERLA